MAKPETFTLAQEVWLRVYCAAVSGSMSHSCQHTTDQTRHTCAQRQADDAVVVFEARFPGVL